jgi:hypothetical protein
MNKFEKENYANIAESQYNKFEIWTEKGLEPASVNHLLGELYFRIEELENKLAQLEIYLPKPASR